MFFTHIEVTINGSDVVNLALPTSADADAAIGFLEKLAGDHGIEPDAAGEYVLSTGNASVPLRLPLGIKYTLPINATAKFWVADADGAIVHPATSSETPS